MYSPKRLFLPPQAPNDVPVQAWRALRLALITTLVYLGALGLLSITALASLFIPQRIAVIAIISELTFIFLGSVLSLSLGL